MESREGKRPQLSDLRESGAIEQDADIVAFIHRPEYYHITEDEQGNSLLGVAQIIIAKHRNGATGDVHLAFKSELAKFSDMETGFQDGYPGSEGSVTFGSKMNDEQEETAGAGIYSNSGFDKEGSSDSVPF